ncbi:TLR adapter interacting with SLC15A4 on the lysosome [Protopterus annectens]|uniref:TLR adapter interacting with SLC15A4 on the lysosome n=1 Tax=Protopterus annectens TaxID=7888 RepID=UPI001CFA80AE|nr:TLR adapter interacting with SLC15A4 on the lysosome [Protopterus annectens]XP_043928316.1 TLR adapter interacting with SLC15A4 on the lysosome [Protopterus annectens]
MLAEGYLYVLAFWEQEQYNASIFRSPTEENRVEELPSVAGITYSSTGDLHRRSFFQRCKSIGRFITRSHERKEDKVLKESTVEVNQDMSADRKMSCVVDIPGSASIGKDTYLVPSSCKSICKNYNDLHIAGDQVMPLDSTTTDFTCDSSVEFYDGPFLQSSEIPSPMESLRMTHELPRRTAAGDSSCWRLGSAKDKSIMHPSQPLSNSMLNEYLEQKMMELYKQYMMDNMLHSVSPSNILACEHIMNNVDQICIQISREQNMETSKAKDMVLTCLLQVASGRQSTEISTPYLLISSEGDAKQQSQE